MPTRAAGYPAACIWRALSRPDPAAGKAEPSVHPLLEKLGAQEAIGRHAALGVTDKPERSDVLLAVHFEHVGDDVLEMLVIGLCDPPP